VVNERAAAEELSDAAAGVRIDHYARTSLSPGPIGLAAAVPLSA
jgi:hypothetical protein